MYSTSAKDVYIEVLEYTNRNVSYYKVEEKNYMHEALVYTKNIEIVEGENNKVHSMIKMDLGKGDGITTVSNGADIC